MAIVVGVIFILIAVAALVAYGGTPHGGPTTTCTPIQIMGHTYTAATDCRYVSAAEVAVAVLFFLLAALILLAARPR